MPHGFNNRWRPGCEQAPFWTQRSVKLLLSLSVLYSDLTRMSKWSAYLTAGNQRDFFTQSLTNHRVWTGSRSGQRKVKLGLFQISDREICCNAFLKSRNQIQAIGWKHTWEHLMPSLFHGYKPRCLLSWISSRGLPFPGLELSHQLLVKLLVFR